MVLLFLLDFLRQERIIELLGTYRTSQQHRHWAAVLPTACQPDDCGAEVNALAFEKRIGDRGVRFAVALFEEEGEITPISDNVFRLATGGFNYLVFSGAPEQMVERQGVKTRARLAVVVISEGLAKRAWLVDGSQLTVNGRDHVKETQPVTREISLE